MVLIDDEPLGDTIISRNTVISGNIMTKRIELVLSYINIGIHTGDAKYRI